MLFRPIGVRLSHAIGTVQLYPTPIACSTTNQSGSILTNRTVLCRPIKLWRFGVFICMKTNPSGTRGGGLCLYKSAPLWLGEHFPFPLKTVFPHLELKHLWRCLSHSSKVEWTGSEQVEQSCLARGRVWPQGHLAATLLHNWAVLLLQRRCSHSCARSQLSSLQWLKLPSGLHPELGISVGVELILVTTRWQISEKS